MKPGDRVRIRRVKRIGTLFQGRMGVIEKLDRATGWVWIRLAPLGDRHYFDPRDFRVLNDRPD